MFFTGIPLCCLLLLMFSKINLIQTMQGCTIIYYWFINCLQPILDVFLLHCFCCTQLFINILIISNFLTGLPLPGVWLLMVCKRNHFILIERCTCLYCCSSIVYSHFGCFPTTLSLLYTIVYKYSMYNHFYRHTFTWCIGNNGL